MTILLAHAMAKDIHKEADYICVEIKKTHVYIYVYEFNNEGDLRRTDYTNGVKEINPPEYSSLRDTRADLENDKDNKKITVIKEPSARLLKWVS